MHAQAPFIKAICMRARTVSVSRQARQIPPAEQCTADLRMSNSFDWSPGIELVREALA